MTPPLVRYVSLTTSAARYFQRCDATTRERLFFECAVILTAGATAANSVERMLGCGKDVPPIAVTFKTYSPVQEVVRFQAGLFILWITVDNTAPFRILN